MMRLILLTVLLIGGVMATPNVLTLSNPYIKVVVNNEEYDTGRFAIETIKGDPSRVADDNAPLIYGRPKPWTSYTTFKINDVLYGFGGDTRKRAGKSLKYGTVLSQEISQNGIVTRTMMGEVLVTQRLSFIRNPMTQVNDAVLIYYNALNQSKVTQNVGLRLMMDTMLGLNDAAPFRIGAAAYESEQKFDKKLPDYWQAFDSLVSPNVMAQGVFKDPALGITSPDKVLLSNWGLFADFAWEFPYKEGRSFVREGELEQDTALALYWKPLPLGPGQEMSRSTLYGLGGVDLKPGQLSLGLTAPKERSKNDKNKFMVVGYIVNTGGYDSENTVVDLQLPKGFKIHGVSRQKLGVLSAGESRQIVFSVSLGNGVKKGIQKMTMTINSSTLPKNFVSRDITVTGPPSINGSLNVPRQVSRGFDQYVDLSLKIYNPNRFPLSHVNAKLILPIALQLPLYESSQKGVTYLPAKSSKMLHWKLKVVDWRAALKRIKVTLSSPLIKTTQIATTLKVVNPKATFNMRFLDGELVVDDYFSVKVSMENAHSFSDLNMSLEYDPEMLSLVRLSTPDWIRETQQAGFQRDGENNVQLRGLSNQKDAYFLSLGLVHFKLLKAGPTVMILKRGNTIVDKIYIK